MDNQENRYQVCIRCFTFNHRNYIEDAMHGFVMQQTKFPYIAVVVDDASTDGEPEVIKRFLEKEFDMASAVQDETDDFVKVVAKHKTNVNCTFVVVFLKYNHYSIKKRKLPYFKEWHDNAKYIALCEGDDYWTDPLKLQKQVDFLEEHEEYSLCCHRYKIFEEDGNVWKPDYVVDLFEQNPDGFTFTSTDNLHHWITKTMTLMYRKSALPDGYSRNYRYCRDVHMNYHLLQNGPGYCMPDDMAVYRRHQRGIFSPLSKKEKERINLLIHCEILQNNPNDPDLKHFAKNEVDSYFNQYVKCPIGCHKFSSNTYRDIRLVLNEYRIFNGRFKSVVYILKKCTKAYLKGFKKK